MLAFMSKDPDKNQVEGSITYVVMAAIYPMYKWTWSFFVMEIPDGDIIFKTISFTLTNPFSKPYLANF